MSRLNLGRLVFFGGILTAFIGGIYLAYFSEDRTVGNQLFPVAGGVIALVGVVILFSSRQEAVTEYKKLENEEANKQIRRNDTEAERMKFGGWGDWEEFTQIRRLHKDMVEFRKSTPFCMVAALGLLFAAIDMTFLGVLLPRPGLYAGIITAVTGVGVFMIGRGIVFDGSARKVIRWWGWVIKPIFSYELDLSNIAALVINRKLGVKPGEARVGRTVRYPIFLLRKKGLRILLKTCPSLTEARSLGREISHLIDVPVREQTGEGQTREKAHLKRRILPKKLGDPHLTHGNIENYVRNRIVEIAGGEFPDNRDLEWIIHGFERKNDLVFVEVEPVPLEEFAYPRVKFVITPGKSGGVDVVATYCLDGNAYTLLSAGYGFRKLLPGRINFERQNS